MVRLDRIAMQGFKSFAGRVVIPFPSGFNCICGPNGSGKSNTIDALTFVLGTSSARSIRADKLQNLIFNGAKDKKPAEFCEVSLYIDNSDTKIPGHEKEVKITRKVNRSGVSIYKVDGKTETRAKIVDLLSNANITPDGYNIIMQGDVTRIIEMNSIERRQILDDISGISEFDDKKEKATKELEKVETRIRENMIVLAEKQNLVSKLKSEKENAEKYEKYSNDLKKSKASLLKTRLKETQERFDIVSKEIDSDSKLFDSMEKEFREIEKDLEKNEKEIQKASNELISKSRNYEILRKIDTMNNEILRKEDKIELNDREMQRLNASNTQEQKNYAVSSVLKLGYNDIYGTISSLVQIPKKYSTAISVALGKHTSDVIIETDDTATSCIKYLKENKIGRVRFLPLNRIHYKELRKYEGKEKILGYAIDLIDFDKKYEKALQITLKNTIVVENIEIAKRIRNLRVVTLDGDLAEESGAMIGGFLRRSQIDHSSDINRIEEENEKLHKEIEKMQSEIEKLRSLEKEESEEVTKLQSHKEGSEKKVDEFRSKFKKIQEERLILQSKISKNKIEKARIEAGLDNIRIEYDEYKDVSEFITGSVEELQERVRRCLIEINKLGPVNMKAIEEFKNFNVEFEELKKKLDKMLEEKDAIMAVVKEVEGRRFEKFMNIFKSVSNNFTRIYYDLTGGAGSLRLEIENSIDSGLVIEASPVGKKVLNLDSMSGGEKTMTSLAFLFAVMQHYSSPFYVLDEIDAALDKSNTKKIVNLVKKYSKEVQFLVISHNDTTIGEADKVFGVSMEDGVSKVFGIDMPEKNV